MRWRLVGPVRRTTVQDLVPVDPSDVVMAALVAPFQVRIGEQQAERLRLRHAHVDESLPKLVIGEALDLPVHRLLLFGDSSSGGPNIISAGHHQWLMASCGEDSARRALCTMCIGVGKGIAAILEAA
jgi:hypothetical protein